MGRRRQKNRKNVLKCYGLAILVFFIFFIIAIPDIDDKESSNEEIIVEEDEQDTEIEVVEEDNEEVEKENESVVDIDIIDTNYLLMWHNYTDEYEDKYLRLAGKVNYVGESHVNIKEGLEGITGNIYLTFEGDNADQLESLSEGDYIIVTGRNSGRFSGQINIEDSNIEEIGEKALERVNEEKEAADKEFEKKRIEADKLEKEEKDKYMSSVATVNYEDILRNPHEYKDKQIKVTIKITQLMSGGILKDSGYAGKEGDKEWYISYKLPEGSTRIIEGDSVTFYGEFDDVVEMKRALTNSKAYIPRLKARYFEFSN